MHGLRVHRRLERVAAAGALLGLFGDEGDEEIPVEVCPLRIGGGDRSGQDSVGVFVDGDGAEGPAKEPASGDAGVSCCGDFAAKVRVSS